MGSRIGNRSWTINRITLLNLKIVISTFLIYLLNRFYLKTILSYKFIHYYFNDLLAGILIIAYCNFILDLSKYKFRFDSIKNTLPFIIVVGLFYEYVTPLYLNYSTSDIIDVLFYAVGAMIYLVIMKIYNKTKVTS